MRTLLWLDDVRDPFENPDWLVFSPIGNNVHISWVKTYPAFVHWIMNNGLPDGICFDHDLGEPPMGLTGDLKYLYSKTGYDCAKWLVEYCMDNQLNLPPYGIQSANPVGRENIDKLLKSFNKTHNHE